MPTFVSEHTFCASPKPGFKHAHTGLDIDAVNYTTEYTTKIEAKFSNGDQINFNKPVLKPARGPE